MIIQTIAQINNIEVNKERNKMKLTQVPIASNHPLHFTKC